MNSLRDFRFFLAFIVLICEISKVKPIKINCDLNTLENCLEDCYQCTVKKLIVTKPNKVTVINGFQQDEGSTQNVSNLRIIDQVAHFFPSDFDRHFPHLSVLKVWSSGLRFMSQIDLKKFPYLTVLSLLGNLLENLDSNLFMFNKRLIKIDFTRNRLKHVGTNLLRPLEALKFADFYDNDCINGGAQNSFDFLKRNLREKCPPTNNMLLDDIESLTIEVDYLRLEVEKRERKIKVCTDGIEAQETLDSLFPSISVTAS